MQRAALVRTEEVLARRTLDAEIGGIDRPFTGAMVGTGVHADPQHGAQALRGKRGERLEDQRQVRADLQAGIEDRCGPVHVGLGDLPRLGVGNVLVADTGDVHRLLQGLTEMIGLDVFLKGIPGGDDLRERFGVDGLRFQVRRHLAAEILVGQDHGPVDEVAENGDQLRVVALLEVLPRKVVVLGLGSVGAQHVAEHVLLALELLDEFVDPYGPAAGGRDLVAFQVQELVGGDIVRQDIVAIGLQHGRKDDAMEHDVVLADEMHQFRVLGLPPFLPGLRKQFLGVGDVTDRRVEPYIEHLALGAFDRYRDAPVQVTADGPRLQAAVQPALALAIDIGFPLLVLIQDPVAEPWLVPVQRQIPVLGLALLDHAAAQAGMRVDQFGRTEGAAALFALVAIGMRIAAFRAGSFDVAVCQKGLRFDVIVLLALLGDELVVVVELAEELGSVLLMDLGGRPGIDIEIDAQSGEGILHDLVVFVHDVLRGDTLFTCLDGNRHAMFVAAADEDDILATQAQIPYIDVTRDIGTGKVADVDRAVGVRKRTGHEGSFELLVHIFTL